MPRFSKLRKCCEKTWGLLHEAHHKRWCLFCPDLQVYKNKFKPTIILALSNLEATFPRKSFPAFWKKQKHLSKILREGFQAGSYLNDSGLFLPYKVQSLKSGKCSRFCNFFGRNNIGHHCVVVGIQTGVFTIRNLTRVSISSAPKSVGSKAPPWKCKRQEVTSFQIALEEEKGEQFTAHTISDTTVVIRKSTKPGDSPPSAPLILNNYQWRNSEVCWMPVSVTEGYDEGM